MSRKAHGQIRSGQVISIHGPGALIDLPRDSAIIGGLQTWPKPGDLEAVNEPRLAAKLQRMTNVPSPKLYAPPPDSNDPTEPVRGIGAYRFPGWYVVQEKETGRKEIGKKQKAGVRSRRLVPRKALDEKRRFDGCDVVPTRFVRACPKGHVADVDWRRYVHVSGDRCARPLWLDERGTGGDLADLIVRCECGRKRSLYEAAQLQGKPLETCPGTRPWLGPDTDEDCALPSRLLIRTASNAYFPQVFSVLSLPERRNEVEQVVEELWEDLQLVKNAEGLAFIKGKPKVANRLLQFTDEEVLAAILRAHEASMETDDRPVKQVELDAILAAPEGFGDDIPPDPDFHARRLPERVWRHRPDLSEGIESVIQLHRLREVRALVGFTRFEAVTPDIDGEYENDVKRAQIALEPSWFPAVENRGEGVFIHLRAKAVEEWHERPAVRERVKTLERGHILWMKDRPIQRAFPGGPYVLLHTISHLLLQSLAMRCGYPAGSIRERIYSDTGASVASGRYGILLYTGSPDAEGTLGGLVQQARHVEDHLEDALRSSALCSNDPVCSQHAPGQGFESRWLQGAACHGCALVAETSCEMRNDYLDRALVVPVLGIPDAAFFPSIA